MKETKKIALVCNYRLDPNRIGGMDRFFKAYNEELLQKGYKPTWFFSGGEKFDFYLGLELNFAGQKESIENYTLKYLTKNNSFDAVITHFLPLCTSFFKKLKEYNQPYIIAVDHNPRPLQGFPLKKRLINLIKGKLYSRYIARYVGVSQYTANCIIQDYGNHLKKKTTVVYNGIETSVYFKRTEKNHGKFLVASHLRESKGIQDLIEAVKILPAKILSLLQIDIYGEGPLENHLKERVRSYELEDQIKFKGSTSKLPELIKDYSFLLQPTYMECFSLSILESLAANVPVITTPVGGNLEIIEHGVNGYIFEAGDIQEFSRILQQILLEEIKIEQRVDYNIRDNYNLKKMVQEHINILPCT